MKTRVKRLLLTTGVLGSAAVPFGAVISCSSGKKNNYVETPYTYSPFYAIDGVTDDTNWNDLEMNFERSKNRPYDTADMSYGLLGVGREFYYDIMLSPTPGLYFMHVNLTEGKEGTQISKYNNHVYKHNFNNDDYSDEILHSMLAQYGGYGEKYFKEIKTFVNNYFDCKVAPELAMSYYNSFNEPDFSKVYNKKIFINSIGGPSLNFIADLFKPAEGVVTNTQMQDVGMKGAEMNNYSGPSYGSLVLNQVQYSLRPKAMFGLIPKFASILPFNEDTPSNWYDGLYPQEVINNDNVGETYKSYSDQKVQEMFAVAKGSSSKVTYDTIKAKYDNKTISNIELLKLMTGNFDLKVSELMESISWGIKIIDAIRTDKLIKLLKDNNNEVYLYGHSYGWANYSASMLMKPSIVENANKISLLCNHFSEAIGGAFAELAGGVPLFYDSLYKNTWSAQEFDPHQVVFLIRAPKYIQEKYGELHGFSKMFLKNKRFLNSFQQKVLLYNASNDESVGSATQRELNFYKKYNLNFSIYQGSHRPENVLNEASNFIDF